VHCRFAQGNEANVVHQLLDEVLSTALERAIEPQLLEGMVLDKIMGSQTPSRVNSRTLQQCKVDYLRETSP